MVANKKRFTESLVGRGRMETWAMMTTFVEAREGYCLMSSQHTMALNSEAFTSLTFLSCVVFVPLDHRECWAWISRMGDESGIGPLSVADPTIQGPLSDGCIRNQFQHAGCG